MWIREFLICTLNSLEAYTGTAMKIFNALSNLFIGKPEKIAPESSRAERGKFGEDLASNYCKDELGFKMVARNWHWKQYEIDIICLDAGVLVFVEVRSRAAHSLVSGFHSIGKKKKIALQRACKAYINQLQYPPKHIRFDVIEVSISEEGDGELQYYSNVSLFSKHYTTER